MRSAARCRALNSPPLPAQGERDPYLLAAMAEPPAALVPDARVVRFADASHWVHWDKAAEVNADLLALLRRQPRCSIRDTP